MDSLLINYFSSILLVILNIIILCFWFEDKKSAAAERKDMLDRLMSKDIVEYKENTLEVEPEEPETEDPNLLDLEDAREEIMAEEENEE